LEVSMMVSTRGCCSQLSQVSNEKSRLQLVLMLLPSSFESERTLNAQMWLDCQAWQLSKHRCKIPVLYLIYRHMAKREVMKQLPVVAFGCREEERVLSIESTPRTLLLVLLKVFVSHLGM
jgi:hypothetical protein